MYHDPPLVFDVEEDPGEQWPLDPEADAVKPLVHRAWREFQRLNATIVRHEPLQVGGDRKYAICQRERLEDCFPPVPASAEECRAGDHECHTADWGFTSNLHEQGGGRARERPQISTRTPATPRAFSPVQAPGSAFLI